MIYDVPKEFNKVRTKIAQCCKNHGLERIEYSVFLGDMSPNEAETLAMELEDLTREISADIRIFPICQNCLKKSIIVRIGALSWDFQESIKGSVEFV